MAESARLLSRGMMGRLTFRQYLVLFGFIFIPFWMLGPGLDIAYSIVFGVDYCQS